MYNKPSAAGAHANASLLYYACSVQGRGVRVTRFAKGPGTAPGPAGGAQHCTRRYRAVILGSTAVQRLLPAPATRALPVVEGSACKMPRTSMRLERMGVAEGPRVS